MWHRKAVKAAHHAKLKKASHKKSKHHHGAKHHHGHVAHTTRASTRKKP